MSKILEASCVAGVVTSEGVPVPGATVLSKGVGSSEGLLLIQGSEKTYLTLQAADLETTIDKVITGLTKASDGLIAAGAALNGIAAGTGVSTALAGTQILTVITELTTLKGQLK